MQCDKKQGIVYIESPKSDYKTRTEQNVLETDGTLAIAIDPNSFGEILTHKLCIKHNKPYLMIDLSSKDFHFENESVEIIAWIVNNNIENLNVAGNSLYTFAKKYPKITQYKIDQIVFLLFKGADLILKNIQSGGQTGIDESAIKIAIIARIPSKIICPKGWKFRDIKGQDISNEQLFKERFNSFEIEHFAICNRRDV